MTSEGNLSRQGTEMQIEINKRNLSCFFEYLANICPFFVLQPEYVIHLGLSFFFFFAVFAESFNL